MTTPDFESSFAMGNNGEDVVVQWLNRSGLWVDAVSQEINPDGGGQRIKLPNGETVTRPDILAINPLLGLDSAIWIEVKFKSYFIWYQKRQQWRTGVDARLWKHYLILNDHLGWPVWLMFLHQPHENGSEPGLWGGKINTLRRYVHKQDAKDGDNTMVYFLKDDLDKLCEWPDIINNDSEIYFRP